MGNERYSRQTMLAEIGDEGQRRIKEASVLIVGVGGLGSAVATYLTGAGVGRIGLVDHDTVSSSNLQRQVLYTERSVGFSKVEEAKCRLSAMSSETQFDIYPDGLNNKNAIDTIRGYDLVVDCCDNFTTRYLIDDVCFSLGVPWVHGAISEFSGQLAVFNYHSGRRYSDLFYDRERLVEAPRVVLGVIGVVPGVIGTMQASEALKLIVGYGDILDGRLFMIDLKTMESQIIEI